MVTFRCGFSFAAPRQIPRLYYIGLYYSMLHYNTWWNPYDLQDITSQYNILHCNTLYNTYTHTLQYITLQYNLYSYTQYLTFTIQHIMIYHIPGSFIIQHITLQYIMIWPHDNKHIITYIYIYIHIYIYVYIYIYIYNILTILYIHICVYMCTHIYTYTTLWWIISQVRHPRARRLQGPRVLLGEQLLLFHTCYTHIYVYIYIYVYISCLSLLWLLLLLSVVVVVVITSTSISSLFVYWRLSMFVSFDRFFVFLCCCWMLFWFDVRSFYWRLYMLCLVCFIDDCKSYVGLTFDHFIDDFRCYTWFVLLTTLYVMLVWRSIILLTTLDVVFGLFYWRL